jgi:hypothetical protein
MKEKYPITSKILTNLVLATAVGTVLFVLLMSLTGSMIQVLWSDAAIIMGLFIVVPVYITIFSIVTWAVMLYKK